ncbi:MAG: GyrI-like domain-containing protein [Christensenellaceae bacterium]
MQGILGICFSEAAADSGFPYGIGAEYNGALLESEDLKLVEIPAHTYAVFSCKGKMPEAFKETYRQICTEFFRRAITNTETAWAGYILRRK